MAYIRKPLKDNCFYKDFSLENNITKSGLMNWGLGIGNGTTKNVDKPIILNGKYKLEWNDYSVIDDSNSGMFKILVNEISKTP